MTEIKITGNTPLEALASLTAFGIRCMGNEEVYAAASRILEAEQAKERKEATKVTPMPREEAQAMVDAAKGFDPSTATPQPDENHTAAPSPENPQAPADLPPEPYVGDPPHGDPEPAPEPETQGEPAPDNSAPTYTIEQIRERGTAAARAHGNQAVKAILKELGVGGMTALTKEQYPTFLEKLAALEGTGGTDA